MSEPDAQAAPPALEPLEAHIVALRAELVRVQLALRIATGALLALALVAAAAQLAQGRAGAPDD